MGLAGLTWRVLGLRQGRWVQGVPLVLGAFVLGCHGGDDDDDKAPTCSVPADARGSDACHAWQRAICDYAAKCGTLVQCDCIAQARAITCASDDEATRCTQALASAACTATSELSGCDLVDMADPAPAIAGCQAYVSAFCSAGERCGGDTASDCEATAMGSGTSQIDCNNAIGVQPSLDQCLSELETVSCSAASAPKSCDHALLLSQ
jgi:hypothetical protein